MYESRNTFWAAYLSMDSWDLTEGVVDWGSRCRSNEGSFVSVGSLKRAGTSPANIHDMETWLYTLDKIDTSYMGQL